MKSDECFYVDFKSLKVIVAGYQQNVIGRSLCLLNITSRGWYIADRSFEVNVMGYR